MQNNASTDAELQTYIRRLTPDCSLCLSHEFTRVGTLSILFYVPFIYILFVAVALAENQFTESLDADTRSQPTMDHPTSFISL